MMLTSLVNIFSRFWAIFISTFVFVFGPLHGPRLWVYWQQGNREEVFILIAIFTATSLFFSWLRLHLDNTLVPALIHGTGNAITWVAVFPLILANPN